LKGGKKTPNPQAANRNPTYFRLSDRAPAPQRKSEKCCAGELPS
jgi:hypothetical protein